MESVEAFHHDIPAALFGGPDLPYWLAIGGATVALRVLMTPIMVKMQQNAVKMQKMAPEQKLLQERMESDPRTKGDDSVQKKCVTAPPPPPPRPLLPPPLLLLLLLPLIRPPATTTTTTNSPRPALSLRYMMQMKALWKKHDVNPLSPLLGFAQIPVFISMFFGMKTMHEYYPGMETGGAAWFTDLSVADPTYVLPVLNGLTFLAMVRFGADGMSTPDPKQKEYFQWGMSALAVITVPMTAHFPAAVFCYWVPQNIYSLGLTKTLAADSVRKGLGLPTIAEMNKIRGEGTSKPASMAETLEKMQKGVESISRKVAGKPEPLPPPPPIHVATDVVGPRSGAVLDRAFPDAAEPKPVATSANRASKPRHSKKSSGGKKKKRR